MRWWGWLSVFFHVAVVVIMRHKILNAPSAVREFWRGSDGLEQFLLVFLGPPLAGFTLLLTLGLPVASALGHDISGPADGCYRITSEFNVATKTTSRDYDPIPCP